MAAEHPGALRLQLAKDLPALPERVFAAFVEADQLRQWWGPAGFAVPLHTHTYDMKVVIVSGTYIQAPEGKPEFRLGPGSYFLQPGGSYRHTTTCDKAAECVFFVESKGPFDLKPVAATTAPAQ